VSEILPDSGSSTGGTRCVLIGSNFIESPNLTVKVGDIIIKPEFHENCSLIITTPPSISNTKSKIQISNDGKEYCDSNIYFIYT